MQLQTGGLLPVNATYDNRGRLASLTQGTGPDTRTTTLSYNTDGYLNAITDPLGRSTTFTYDAAGRLLSRDGA